MDECISEQVNICIHVYIYGEREREYRVMGTNDMDGPDKRLKRDGQLVTTWREGGRGGEGRREGGRGGREEGHKERGTLSLVLPLSQMELRMY